MSHTFTVPDEAYRAIETVAASQGQTPEALFQAWLAEIERAAWRQMDVERDADGNPVIYASTAEFLASLGADDEQVARMRAREEAAERNGAVEQVVFAEYDDAVEGQADVPMFEKLHSERASTHASFLSSVNLPPPPCPLW